MANERPDEANAQQSQQPAKQPAQPQQPSKPKPAEAGARQKDHPASAVTEKFREASTLVKARAGGVSANKRMAEVLHKLADACEAADKYTTERGTGFDDKPTKGGAYEDSAVKAMRYDLHNLLGQARQDVATNAAILNAQRGSRPTALPAELEMILRQLISALLSQFFGGMRFEGEELDADAAQIVTRAQPRRSRPQPRTHPR